MIEQTSNIIMLILMTIVGIGIGFIVGRNFKFVKVKKE